MKTLKTFYKEVDGFSLVKLYYVSKSIFGNIKRKLETTLLCVLDLTDGKNNLKSN